MPRFFIVLVWTVLLSPLHTAGQTILAVAERNNYAGHVSQRYGQYHTWIRPLFIKRDTGWTVMDSLPPRMQLFPFGSTKPVVANRCRNLRTVSCWDDVLYRKTSGLHKWQKFPEPDSIFGFRDIVRFQLLVSKPNVHPGTRLDADSLTETESARITDTIVKRARNLAYKDIGDTAGFVPSDRLLLPGADSFLIQFENAVVLNNGASRKLVFQIFPQPSLYIGSALSPSAHREDNGSVLRVFSAIDPDGTPHVFYADMRLLEHADFDGDGLEEYLFFCSRFNGYGYMLLYDDFRRVARYEWTYH